MDNEKVIIVRSDPGFEWQRKAPKKRGIPKALTAVLAILLVAAVSVGSAAAYLHFYKADASADRGASTIIQQVQTVASIGTAESRESGQKTIPEVYAEGVKSTVIFTCKIPVSSGYFFGFGNEQRYSTAFGSGVIMTADGYILTNAHVVEGAEEITVTMYDGTEYKASVIGKDTNTDVAVVKVNATGLPAATFGDSDSLLVGQDALAIGNPLSSQLAFSLTCGHISALEREIEIQGTILSLMQIDAAVNPGNSGGPLFDIYGNVIGIVNAKITDTDVEGIGFAVPINTALEVARSLVDYGYVAGRPTLGITIQSVTAQQAQLYGLEEGITVVEVLSGSCAEKGGVMPGDKITHFNGVAVSTSTELNFQKGKYKIGDAVTITVVRDGQSRILNITLSN